MKIKRKSEVDKEEKKPKKQKIVSHKDDNKDEVIKSITETKQEKAPKSTKISFSSLLPKPQYTQYHANDEESDNEENKNEENKKPKTITPAEPVVKLYQSDNTYEPYSNTYQSNNYNNTEEEEEESILPMPKSSITVEETHDNHVQMYPGPKANLPV